MLSSALRSRFAGATFLSGLVVLAALALTTTVASGTISTCQITDKAIKKSSYGSLAAAVAAASAGDTLLIRGTCRGTTEIGKSLTLIGQQPSGYSAPTLRGQQLGSVLTIDSGISVTINSLTITGGVASFGGGIYNVGTLTLQDSIICGNDTYDFDGGGIYNAGTLTLHGSSSISFNDSASGGGGISNHGTVTLADGSSISGNRADELSGGGIDNSGTVTLKDSSSISGNTANDAGGGIFNNGTVTLKDSSTISGNTANEDGGGIYNNLGTLSGAVAGSNVYGNTPNDIVT